MRNFVYSANRNLEETIPFCSVKHAALKQDLALLRQQRDQLAVAVDAAKSRVLELDNGLASKDKACAELKASLEFMRQCKNEADEAMERRYQVG